MRYPCFLFDSLGWRPRSGHNFVSYLDASDTKIASITVSMAGTIFFLFYIGANPVLRPILDTSSPSITRIRKGVTGFISTEDRVSSLSPAFHYVDAHTSIRFGTASVPLNFILSDPVSSVPSLLMLELRYGLQIWKRSKRHCLTRRFCKSLRRTSAKSIKTFRRHSRSSTVVLYCLHITKA